MVARSDGRLKVGGWPSERHRFFVSAPFVAATDPPLDFDPSRGLRTNALCVYTTPVGCYCGCAALRIRFPLQNVSRMELADCTALRGTFDSPFFNLKRVSRFLWVALLR